MPARAASLVASLSSSSGTYDLTAEGPADWRHWNFTPHRKNSLPNIISDASTFGAGTVWQFPGNSIAHMWSDGTPLVFNITDAVRCKDAVGGGYQITVVADTQPRTLKLWVGAVQCRARIDVSLSDGSAGPYTDTGMDMPIAALITDITPLIIRLPRRARP